MIKRNAKEYLRIKKELFKFLKEEGAYGKYMSYIRVGLVEGEIDNKLEALLTDEESLRLSAICGVFAWTTTNEGYDFWSNIHYKWIKYSKQL